MSQDEGSFFSRWSRRKAQVRQGVPPVDTPPAGPVVDGPLPAATGGAKPVANPEQAALNSTSQATAPGPTPSPAAAPPPPTLEDVQALTPESNFSRFVARDVDPQVKNLAMKKLFADPHFGVMDGLDTYIDDYNTPDPLPKAMLRQLVQARSLGLLDDEMPEQPAPPQEAAAVEQTPASPEVTEEPTGGGTPAEEGLAEDTEAAVRTQAPTGLECTTEPADPAVDPPVDQRAVPRSSSES